MYGQMHRNLDPKAVLANTNRQFLQWFVANPQRLLVGQMCATQLLCPGACCIVLECEFDTDVGCEHDELVKGYAFREQKL